MANSLVLALIIMGLAAANGYSFYHLDEKDKKPLFQMERRYVSWGKGERAFAVYDNFNHFSTKHHRGPLVCPTSDHFIPADRIAGNIPLRIAIRQPMTVENTLSNLLYANLKLKKLVEEYEALQKESRELLTDLTIPFVDFGFAKPEQIDKTGSIYSKKEQLAQDSRIVSRFLEVSTATTENAVQSGTTGTRPLAGLLDEQKNREASSRDLSESLQSESLQSGPKDLALLLDASQTGLESQDPLSDITQRQSARILDDEEVSLPWIFRFLLNIVQYLFSHKIEALIYGVLLFFAVTIWSSVKAR